MVILCGHYEGVDERVLEEIVTDYVSIGDYVLTGGELPAMVMVDGTLKYAYAITISGRIIQSAAKNLFFMKNLHTFRKSH